METLHPRTIELGLERVQAVRRQLADDPRFTIITVGGTNGKGSTVAFLEAMLAGSGYRVGAYTSPHLVDYNERVRINGVPASDAGLCASFERVEAARREIPLTYFEFGTLAAIELLRASDCQVALLEVGLGGRLDAVNAWDADCAIVTSVGLDHTDWLGATRAAIAREKAGIFRRGRPAICGDPDPPPELASCARAIGTHLYQIGSDFSFERAAGGWTWRAGGSLRAGLPEPSMRGDHQLLNASCALMAIECLADRIPVTQAQVRSGLLAAVLPGRFQTLPGDPRVVLDVAHNAEAARALADTLARQPTSGRTIAVVGMLADKPIGEVFRAMRPVVDRWHLASLSGERGAPAAQLAARLEATGPEAIPMLHATPEEAFSAAQAEARAGDRIVVFGSFLTVGAILPRVQRRPTVGG